jgi:Zn-dependent peptidase ImmA (M78 family)
VPDFNVTKELIFKISEQYDISEKQVEKLQSFFLDIKDKMKGQYLAHIIRTLEERLRKIPGNEMFQIACSPVAENSKRLGIAGAHYYKGRYFSIFYHPETEEKQLRILLAHELGHLFLVEFFNSVLGAPKLNEKSEIEPMSTILGIFTILDKNEFYHNKTAPFKHRSAEEVLNDFNIIKRIDKENS